MTTVLLNCLDVVGKTMAGPAIRYWELANVLAKKYDVILFIPNKTDVKTPLFRIISQEDVPLKSLLPTIDVMISQKVSPPLALAIKRNGVKLILDAYDPEPLEHLEIFKFNKPSIRWAKHEWHLNTFLFSFQAADTIICANSKQKDLWIGLMLGMKKITPKIYDEDRSLKHLIDIVPFGLPSEKPFKKNLSLKQLFNLKESDKIVLWGGGIWNWFDPLTLIKAIKLLSLERDDIKLVFMGTKHPNKLVPEMKMTHDAIELAKALNILDTHVFFNYSWIPYHERGGLLLEATLGVSTHFEHLETQYAFRTRILDYLWAELPIVTTTGDSFAELVERQKLGEVVPFNDEIALAKAIQKILTQPELQAKIKENIARVKEEFFWDTISAPITRMVDRLTAEKKHTQIAFTDQVKLVFLSLRTFSIFVLLKYSFLKIGSKLGLKKLFSSNVS